MMVKGAEPLSCAEVILFRDAMLRQQKETVEVVLAAEILFEVSTAKFFLHFSEHLGTLVRDVYCEGLDAPVELDGVPAIDMARAAEATPGWSFDDHYDVLFAHVYDGCSGISYPVHTSPKTAEAARLPAPLVHGTAVFARALAHAVDAELDGDPNKVRLVATRFSGMVFPGDTVTVTGLGQGRFRATKGDAPVLRDCLLLS